MSSFDIETLRFLLMHFEKIYTDVLKSTKFLSLLTEASHQSDGIEKFDKSDEYNCAKNLWRLHSNICV